MRTDNPPKVEKSLISDFLLQMGQKFAVFSVYFDDIYKLKSVASLEKVTKDFRSFLDSDFGKTSPVS